MRAGRPNSSLTLFSIAAPSPKNHEAVLRLGKIGLSDGIGGPGSGSEASPFDGAEPRESPPWPSMSQRPPVDCVVVRALDARAGTSSDGRGVTTCACAAT